MYTHSYAQCWGEQGQLAASAVPGVEKVLSAAAGQSHCLAVTEAGDVLAWGWGACAPAVQGRALSLQKEREKVREQEKEEKKKGNGKEKEKGKGMEKGKGKEEDMEKEKGKEKVISEGERGGGETIVRALLATPSIWGQVAFQTTRQVAPRIVRIMSVV
eukprot:jgi/Mesen1/8528/ME000480S07878